MVRPSPIDPCVPVERLEVCPRIGSASVPKWSFGSTSILSFPELVSEMLSDERGCIAQRSLEVGDRLSDLLGGYFRKDEPKRRSKQKCHTRGEC